MFAYINGKVVSKSPEKAILDVNGIGYLLLIPLPTFNKMPEVGMEARLFTSFIVRELSHTLYGFCSEKDKELFELLINISGVGPKLALSLIGHLELRNLQQAVNLQDVTTLCKVPGVGKKTAERLIVELKDKISHFNVTKSELVALEIDLETHSLTQDAALALTSLGFSQTVAQNAVKKASKENSAVTDLSQLITLALQKI